ncbi:MAG: hypothetical protein LR001_09095 [Clostridiales bacterium]|nr:hypothetical protein [Clostridiales bacterium]
MILLFPIAFLLGRAGILNNLTPFGIAFFVSLYKENKKYFILGLVILAGIVSTQGVYKALPHAVFLLAIVLTFNKVQNFRAKGTYRIAIISMCVFLPIQLLFLLTDTFNLYDVVLIAFELLVLFTVIYISSYAVLVVVKKSYRKILTTEETICLAILGALALAGMGDWNIYNVSLRNTIGILMTIIFAYSGGTGVGSATGITLGLIMSMSIERVSSALIGVFAFGGLLAGLFKDLGKFGSVIGYLLGVGILSFYTNDLHRIIIRWQEILVAIVLFLIIPKAWLLQLKKLRDGFALSETIDWATQKNRPFDLKYYIVAVSKKIC